ncbi:MAG: TIGR02757 family protein [Cyclobacteriaceae bacterium]
MNDNHGSIFELLEAKSKEYNQESFIEADPISVPHRFSKKQDIEIAGLFAAIFAWGQRKTIVKKGFELMSLMDNEPYEFVRNHSDQDLKSLLSFKHRTFNSTDLLYFVHWMRWYYSRHESLESAFSVEEGKSNIEKGLANFYTIFFSLDHPLRTRKHVQTPERKSACKRINMFLRWMVRTDEHGVDFGIWKSIKPSQLICPLDLHVKRVSDRLGLTNRKQSDWVTAIQLTEKLRTFDANDPVKYDFALFGLGVMEQY